MLARRRRKECSRFSTQLCNSTRKILGQVGWSIADLFAVADYFNVEITDLLPRRVPQTQETPDSLSRTEGSNLVAGAGFEPTTSGL